MSSIIKQSHKISTIYKPIHITHNIVKNNQYLGIRFSLNNICNFLM